MKDEWKRHILALRRRTTEAEDRQFVTLVRQASGTCTSEVADTLFLTFSEEEDYGVQESVVAVLGTAEPEVYVTALLKALPRLIDQAPKWARTLVGREVYFAPAFLVTIANRMEKEVGEALVSVITQPDFKEFYPSAMEVASRVKL